mmetsp:Transcript_1810/g.2761  ORF Transcript_1810/g.2761 Transcript_1810/m.2761 type:complete len:680 (-) Transcript_1810:137-2176(-)
MRVSIEPSGHHSPFDVLGIALVAEERGKGACLAFRYPAVPQNMNHANNLFFTLPSRVMAKLFRPKRPLCGQPMTVTVGGTIFCCWAVLMCPNRSGTSSGLVLFSVVVSLIPSFHTSSFLNSSWSYNAEERQRQFRRGSNLYQLQEETDTEKTTSQDTDLFLAVRKVHVSLVRLSRVLEREELRCRYVSLHATELQKIGAEFTASREKAKNPPSSSTSEVGKGRHRRVLTSGSVGGGNIVTEMGMDMESDRLRKIELKERQQLDQEVMDLMLAAKVEGSRIHGNLARELLQVYHALCRNDQSLSPGTAVLSARDSMVFINRHVAVPIESVEENYCCVSQVQVRPYHTLLFPRTSAATLADGITSSNCRIKTFLSMLDPRKSLSEISHETAVPISFIMEMANYLVNNKLCVISHVFSTRCTLACCNDAISRINDLRLAFSQAFHQQPIHCVVSILTMGLTIDELLEKLGSGEAFQNFPLGDALEQLRSDVQKAREEEKMRVRQKAQDENEDHSEMELTQEVDRVGTVVTSVAGVNPHDPQTVEDGSINPFLSSVATLEEFVFAMATWLGAYQVILPKIEYLVAGRFSADCKSPRLVDSMNPSSFEEPTLLVGSDVKEPSDSFEVLYRDLVGKGCFNGRMSNVWLCFKFGLDERTFKQLRSWGLHSGRLKRIVRLPNERDDI